MSLLIELPLDISDRQKDEILEDIMSRGWVQTLRKIVNLGLEIDLEKALIKSAGHGKIDAVKYLLSLDLDISAHGNEALIGAYTNKHIDIICILWSDPRLDINRCQTGITGIIIKGSNTSNLLNKACYHGWLDLIGDLLGKGVNIDGKSMRYAGLGEQKEVISLLLDILDNIDQINLEDAIIFCLKNDETLLLERIVSKSQPMKFQKTFIDHEFYQHEDFSRWDDEDDFAYCDSECEECDDIFVFERIMMHLSYRGKDVLDIMIKGMGLRSIQYYFICMVVCNNYDHVEYLLNEGLITKFGLQQGLLYAIKKGLIDIVELLLGQEGFRPGFKNGMALHWARRMRCREAFKILIDTGKFAYQLLDARGMKWYFSPQLMAKRFPNFAD